MKKFILITIILFALSFAGFVKIITDDSETWYINPKVVTAINPVNAKKYNNSFYYFSISFVGNSSVIDIGRFNSMGTMNAQIEKILNYKE